MRAPSRSDTPPDGTGPVRTPNAVGRSFVPRCGGHRPEISGQPDRPAANRGRIPAGTVAFLQRRHHATDRDPSHRPRPHGHLAIHPLALPACPLAAHVRRLPHPVRCLALVPVQPDYVSVLRDGECAVAPGAAQAGCRQERSRPLTSSHVPTTGWRDHDERRTRGRDRGRVSRSRRPARGARAPRGGSGWPSAPRRGSAGARRRSSE